jgi:hypothetical protein
MPKQCVNAGVSIFPNDAYRSNVRFITENLMILHTSFDRNGCLRDATYLSGMTHKYNKIIKSAQVKVLFKNNLFAN